MPTTHKRPLIGVTGQEVSVKDFGVAPLHVSRAVNLHLIAQLGGIPILLANLDDEKILKEYATMIDGLYIPGGGDIDPAQYGKPREEFTGKLDMHIDPLRDRTEMFLVRKCIRLHKPIFGICRGSQMINVVCGGTLTQHIETAYPGIKETHLHDAVDGGEVQPAHEVVIKSDTRLARLLRNPERVHVNSIHHQAIDTVGTGLQASAQSPKGVIEAIESVDPKSFILGVQWHPERMVDMTSTNLLLKGFVNAAAH